MVHYFLVMTSLRNTTQPKQEKKRGWYIERVFEFKGEIRGTRKEKQWKRIDSGCNPDTMDMDSANISKRSDSSSGGSQDKANSNINPDSDAYIINTIITNNAQSKRLAAITEAASCVSSVTNDDKKINNVKTLYERNQQNNISSSILS